MEDFTNIEEKKGKLLNEFVKLSKGKGSDELLPLTLAFVNKAKEDNISFDRHDIDTVFETLKKDMPPEDLSRAEMIMKMASVL